MKTMKTNPVNLFKTIAIMSLLLSALAPAQPQTPAPALSPAQALAGELASQRKAWMDASLEGRIGLAETLGEEGAEALARKEGWRPLLLRAQKNLRIGPDQIYEAANGKIIVVEAKGGSSPLNSGYGHLQGTPEHAVEGAKRLLQSPSASEGEKAAARKILEAASDGKLEVRVIRTRHVLGKPMEVVVESIENTAPKTAKLAGEYLEQAAQKAVPKVADRTLRAAGPAFRYGGRTLGLAAAPLVVGGVALMEGSHTERQYQAGEIAAQERGERHASTAGGAVGGLGGMGAGAAVGTLAGPPGIIIGGVVGGVGGDAAGRWLAKTAAGKKVGQALQEEENRVVNGAQGFYRGAGERTLPPEAYRGLGLSVTDERALGAR
mgnify:CR=1 FL=1